MSSSQSYGKVKASLVRIWTFNKAGVPISTGTGFVIQSDAQKSTIVTAQHVVDGAASIKIDVDRNLHGITAQVIAKNAADVAVLRASQGNLKPVVFAPGVLSEGAAVGVAGYPGTTTEDALIQSGMGQAPTLIGVGVVGSTLEDGREIQISNLQISAGLSGAPAFDPGSGDVVAMVDSRLENQHVGIGIAATPVLLGFLNASGVGYSTDMATTAHVAPDPAHAKMQQLFFEENYAAASSLAADYLMKSPDDLSANGIIVSSMRSLFLQKLEPEAVRVAKQYLLTHPTDTMANVVVAAGLRSSSPAQSVSRFEAVTSIPLEFRPYAVEAYYNLARQAYKDGDKTAAVARLQRATALGGSPAVHDLLAQLQGDGLVALAPTATVRLTLQEYLLKVQSDFDQDKEDEGVKLALEAVSQYPADGSIPYALFTHAVNKGRALHAVGQFRAEIDYLEHAGTLLTPISKPYAIKLLVMAGETLEGVPGTNPKKADLDEAIRVRDQMLAIDPNSGYANLWAALLESDHLHDMAAAKKYILVAKAHDDEFNDSNKYVLNQQMRQLGVVADGAH